MHQLGLNLNVFYFLISFIAFVLCNFGIYGYLYTDCLFLDCLCDGSKIKCPRDSSVKFEFFPKRNQRTSRPTPFNITFDVSDNSLFQIPDDRFNDLDLDLANFSRNKIREVYSDAFLGIRRLRHLDLSHNIIHEVQKNAFNPVRSTLITLNLENNTLSIIDRNDLSERFEKLNRLTYLNLALNKFNYIPDLFGLSQLKTLSLESNSLESADLLFRRQLPESLVYLNLNKNELKQIDQESFGHLKNLQYLHLASNYISQISEDAFENLVKLLYLDLSNNCLRHIPSKIFYSLLNLEILDLSSQQKPIKQIDDYAFDRLSNEKFMHKINLKNNEIKIIEKKAFCSKNSNQPYVNIKEIDLSENLITNLNACILRQLYKGYSLTTRTNTKISASRLKQQSKPAIRLNQFDNLSNSTDGLLECNCEVSKLSKFADLLGDCKRKTNDLSNYEVLEAKSFNCGEYINLLNVEKYCTSMSQYECKIYDDMQNYLTTSKISPLTTSYSQTTTSNKRQIFSTDSNNKSSITFLFYGQNETLNEQGNNNAEVLNNVNNNSSESAKLNKNTPKYSSTTQASSGSSSSLVNKFNVLLILVLNFLKSI